MSLALNTNNFSTYVRTKMFWRSRLRLVDVMEPVFVPSCELKAVDISVLVRSGEIAVMQKKGKEYMMHLYKALKPGAVDISMLKPPKGKPMDTLTFAMREHLKRVSLIDPEESTDYFNVFLKFKQKYLDLFFTVDEFSGRVHTPISSFHRKFRPGILIDGEQTSSLDVTTMQPLLLGKILECKIGPNEYSQWINEGQDIYLSIQSKAKLESRDKAKKRFFEILFSYADKRLADMFGNANWIEWINEYKSQSLAANPHSQEKQHSNLAWLLQSTEVKIMREVWKDLKVAGIKFLSVHDEIIVKRMDALEAETIFNSIMQKHFQYFKLNSKGSTQLTALEAFELWRKQNPNGGVFEYNGESVQVTPKSNREAMHPLP